MSTYTYQVSSGSATATTDLGTIGMGVRNDALAQLNPTNLAYGFYAVDASGRVVIAATTASADLAKKQNTAFAQSHVGVMMLGVENSSQATFATALGNYTPFAVDTVGGLILSTLSTVTVIQGSDHAEDAAALNGDTGVFVLGVRNDADAGRTSLNSDYGGISIDATGRVKVAGNLVSAAYAVGTANGFLGLGVASAVAPTYGASALWPMSLDLAGNLRTYVSGAITATLASGAQYIGQASAFQTGTWVVTGISSATTATLASGAQYIGQASAFQTGTWVVTAVSSATTANAVTTSAWGPTAIVVTTAAILLASANANRRSLIITNNGSNVLYLGSAASVTTASGTVGLYVQASGGMYSDSGFGLYTGNVFGIYGAASTTHNVSVSERS